MIFKYIALIRRSFKQTRLSFPYFAKEKFLSKYSLCLFLQDTKKYLGDVISIQAVAPDQTKTDAMVK